MKKLVLSIAVVLVSFLSSCSGGGDHFISDSAFMKQVQQDLEAKQKQLPNGDFFSILQNEGLTTYEKEALQFLYAYMPESDIVDQTGDFFLNVNRYFHDILSANKVEHYYLEARGADDAHSMHTGPFSAYAQGVISRFFANYFATGRAGLE